MNIWLKAGAALLVGVGINNLNDYLEKENQKKLGKKLADETEAWLAYTTTDES